MKTLKLKFLAKVNLLLATIIAMLGVGCKSQKNVKAQETEDEGVKNIKHEEMVCMYGIPVARYALQGQVTSTRNTPLEGIVVTVSIDGRKYDAVTDSTGHYVVMTDAFPVDSVSVVCHDPSNRYATETAVRKMDYEGGDGKWNMGEANSEINLQMRTGHDRPLLKYGTPSMNKSN